MRKTNHSSHSAGVRANIFAAKAPGISLGLLLLLAVSFSSRVNAQNAGSDDAKESAHALKLWGTPGEVRLVARTQHEAESIAQRGGGKHREREYSRYCGERPRQVLKKW